MLANIQLKATESPHFEAMRPEVGGAQPKSASGALRLVTGGGEPQEPPPDGKRGACALPSRPAHGYVRHGAAAAHHPCRRRPADAGVRHQRTDSGQAHLAAVGVGRPGTKSASPTLARAECRESGLGATETSSLPRIHPRLGSAPDRPSRRRGRPPRRSARERRARPTRRLSFTNSSTPARPKARVKAAVSTPSP